MAAANKRLHESATTETTFTNCSFEFKDEDGLEIPSEKTIKDEAACKTNAIHEFLVVFCDRKLEGIFNSEKINTAVKTDDGEFENDFADADIGANENSAIAIAVQKIQLLFSIILKSVIFKAAACMVATTVFIAFSVTAIITPSISNSNHSSNNETSSEDLFENKKFIYFSFVGIIASLLIWDNLVANQEVIINLVSNWLKEQFKCLKPCVPYTRIIILTTSIIACFIYLLLRVQYYYNFVSLFGLLVFIAIAALMSYHPSKINWLNLVSGILMQFLLGLFVLRIPFGYNLFKFFGDCFESFLNFARYGSRLVFGEAYAEHFVVFAAIPTALFFAGAVNVLFHLGIAQYIIIKFTWFLHKLINSSPCESMNAIASIFLGQAEAPLLIKPFLGIMTVSELFSVMLGGFATVAGSVFAAFIEYGIPANHLLIASIMSAPAALSISKVIYPETKKTKADLAMIKNLRDKSTKNVFEAFALGACAMISPAASILTNLIVFTAFFEFLNVLIMWLFNMINIDSFGLSDLLKYFFYPVVFLMGIYPEDCSSVAKLVSKKVFVSEFIAFKDLGDVINFRKEMISSGQFELYRNRTLSVPKGLPMIWNERSEVIAAYALCGFSNFAAIGICIGALSAMEPSRKAIFARLASVAMIGGNLACFMTASITGLLYDSKMS